MTIYIDTLGQHVDFEADHLAEQFINSELSIIYFDNDRDRLLLAEAAERHHDQDVLAVARDATKCKKNGNNCSTDGCSGKCELTGVVHFKTCKCSTDLVP